ncbi:MAG: PAS domain S-box protein [Desulfobacteraceae bacterium]|nr:PAS domain S-box protein [Desulfobacteraceae bacterium]
MLNLKKSLILRITLPIIILVIALGAILYFFVLTPVSEFTKRDIEHDLFSLSKRLYKICEINSDSRLLSGVADNPDALSSEQALSLDQIQDLFSKENLKGLIYDIRKKELIFQNHLPLSPEKLFNLHSGPEDFIVLKVQGDNSFAYFSDFRPWNWQIVIVKNAGDYSTLIAKTKRIYLYAFGSLMLLALFLIFFIFQSILGPVRTIINTVRKQQNPRYKGIDIFEFLSETISDMMDSIKQSKEKYQILVENSNHLVWEIDLYYRYTYVSPTVHTILGYLPDEILGNTPFYFLASDEAESVRQYYKEKIGQGLNIEGLVSNNLHKKGHLVVLETIGVPIFNNNEKLVGYRGINRDITKRVRAEEDKINAQKITADQAKQALVGRVAGKMAHDFNNLLGIIMGNTELALLDCQEEETIKTLELTLEQTLQGKNLTKNLVVFAKNQDPKQDFFKISKKIDFVLSLLKKDLNGIELIKEDAPGTPELLADPGMIEHVLVNLFQNAIHATSKSEHPRIIIRTYCDADNICFEIEDNGCGIPKEHLKNIFEPAFTLKGSQDATNSYEHSIKGTGYGMSNVTKYIEQHKGDITLESKVGSGSKFIIRLPVIKKELIKEETIEAVKENVSHGRHILLVEDEAAISNVQYFVLTQEPCNHKVDIAKNGQVAIGLFDKNKYDFISLDYILPGGINGMDVYNYIRETDKIIPILFVSGNIEFLESIEELKQQDANVDYLSKPCQNKDYVDNINGLLTRVSCK